MKNRLVKSILTLFVSVMMVLGSCMSVDARSETDILKELITYYSSYQEDATTDIMRLLDELKMLDEDLASAWCDIMNYWIYVNSDMVVNTSEAPDGLIDDDSLCIVVLGYSLNSDGSMKDELIGRLQTALASANKYPNAYVAVTGGGTASNNPTATEADQMAAWLLAEGLDPDRLIVENQSKSTVQNAQNTYAILRTTYPNIKSLVMVTSDYHIPRGCILYYAQLRLSAYEANDQLLNIVSNAGYITGTNGYESLSLQASGVKQIAGINSRPGSSSTDVALSELLSIVTSGKTIYSEGEELELTTIASYDSDYERDVSSLVKVSGYDSSLIGEQTLTIDYVENEIEVSTSLIVTVNELEKEEELEEEKDEELEKENEEELDNSEGEDIIVPEVDVVETGDNAQFVGMTSLGVVSLLGVYMSLKKIKVTRL